MSRKSPPNRYDREKAFSWLALSRVPGVGSILFNRLIKAFRTPEQVFKASPNMLKSVEGIRSKTVQAITNNIKNDDWVNRELDRLEKLDLALVTLNEECYPHNLKMIYDPPPILYIKGEIRKEDGLALAIVGSRSASSYGKDTTQRLARSLIERGFTIVSGLARGIDTAAHKGTLKAGGRTLAVLGSGIDVIYPWENNRLAEEISEHGAVISEFPLGTKPEAPHFPSRNRIISGLSLGTIIIEASFRSGSLITARLALEQGREVFAVPGNVDSPWSKGTNRLIKEGAKLVTDTEDIIEEVLPQYEMPVSVKTDGPSEPEDLPLESKTILAVLEASPVPIDSLIQKTGFPSGQVSSLLLDLELEGLVQQLPGKLFKKVSY